MKSTYLSRVPPLRKIRLGPLYYDQERDCGCLEWVLHKFVPFSHDAETMAIQYLGSSAYLRLTSVHNRNRIADRRLAWRAVKHVAKVLDEEAGR